MKYLIFTAILFALMACKDGAGGADVTMQWDGRTIAFRSDVFRLTAIEKGIYELTAIDPKTDARIRLQFQNPELPGKYIFNSKNVGPGFKFGSLTIVLDLKRVFDRYSQLARPASVLSVGYENGKYFQQCYFIGKLVIDSNRYVNFNLRNMPLHTLYKLGK